MANNGPAPHLRGRHDECTKLDGLLATVRGEHGQVLVLRGEAGVGKSALVEYVLAHADGFWVARAAGMESEMELAYAGLHQLCAPLLGDLDRLPAPQREALAVAFGRSAGPPPDRFLVGLAVLSLLSLAAEKRPLVCVIDDAQWLDQVSAQTLAFVARRLLGEPVALIFAVRDGEADEFTDLPALAIAPLNDDDARGLLDSVILGRMDARVRDRIVAEARGNPLALLELPRDPTAAQGGFGRPGMVPGAGRIEDSFVRRVQALPAPTRRFLLAAAAEPLGDKALLMRAAGRLGVSLDDGDPAVQAGLIDVGTRVRFRHPLMRSAAYYSADADARRQAHRALADATDMQSDPDRHAWHGANAATGTDDAVADELEQSADRAQAKGGIAAAGAFLERATELTSDPARRGARALAAAEAKFEAADADAATGLLVVAEMSPLSDRQRARAARLRAHIAFVDSRGGGAAAPTVSDAAARLLDAARGLQGLDDEQARETALEALGAAMFAGRLGPRGGIVEIAAPAALASTHHQPPHPNDLLLDGMAALVTAGPTAGFPALRSALTEILDATQRPGADVMDWLWRAFPVVHESAAGELWDEELLEGLAVQAVRLARDAGALDVLPRALSYLAGCRVLAGDLDAASRMIDEAATLTAATGRAPVRYHSLSVAVWRGMVRESEQMIDAATQHGEARGEGRIVGLTGYLAGVLYNSLGRYDEALAASRRACEFQDLGPYGWCLVELIEAAAKAGDRTAASEALATFGERARASGSDWALGSLARSQALLADGPAAEDLYREAIERLGRTRIKASLARAHLVYGEWLHQAGRRGDAREHLGIAHDMFERMGAEQFAERAARGLPATATKAVKRAATAGEALTAQESRIASLAGAGMTNPEIGAQLFISAHTVEWHLRKVFAKLGVTSRRQLPAPAAAQ